MMLHGLSGFCLYYGTSYCRDVWYVLWLPGGGRVYKFSVFCYFFPLDT